MLHPDMAGIAFGKTDGAVWSALNSIFETTFEVSATDIQVTPSGIPAAM